MPTKRQQRQDNNERQLDERYACETARTQTYWLVPSWVGVTIYDLCLVRMPNTIETRKFKPDLSMEQNHSQNQKASITSTNHNKMQLQTTATSNNNQVEMSTELKKASKARIAGQPVRDQAKHGWGKMEIPVLGAHFPLGPCRTTFTCDQLPRVRQVLTSMSQKLSLQTTFHDSPATAYCRSLDQVEFVVSMFKSRKSQDEQEIIICELQRRCGDTISYHRYAQQIISAVKNEEPAQRPQVRSRPSPPPRDCEPPASVITDALELILSAISAEQYETQKLGLESLLFISDPQKSGQTTAKTVANHILIPQSHTGQEIATRVLKLVLDDVSRQDNRQLALAALTQLFKVAAADQQPHQASPNAHLVFLDHSAEELVETVFLPKLRSAQQSPHDAFFAAEGIGALHALVPSLRIDSSHVMKAQAYGNSSHQALAVASEALLVSMKA